MLIKFCIGMSRSHVNVFPLSLRCGSGLSGDYLSEEGHYWVGVDISTAMLGEWDTVPFWICLLAFTTISQMSSVSVKKRLKNTPRQSIA